MTIAVTALQTAAIARYRGDSTLQSLIVGSVTPTYNIFDQGAVPVGQTFPYLVVFPVSTMLGQLLSMGSDANDVTLQVSCYTRYGGMAQARAIMAQVYALTHKQAFTLSGGLANVSVLLQTAQELIESDRITQQVVHRYVCMTEG